MYGKKRKGRFLMKAHFHVKSILEKGLMNDDVKAAMKEKYKVDFTIHNWRSKWFGNISR